MRTCPHCGNKYPDTEKVCLPCFHIFDHATETARPDGAAFCSSDVVADAGREPRVGRKWAVVCMEARPNESWHDLQDRIARSIGTMIAEENDYKWEKPCSMMIGDGIVWLGVGGRPSIDELAPIVERLRSATDDPKLSDRGVRRGTCTVGGKAAAEAGAVTHGAVRCSAWLGVSFISVETCE